MITIKGFRYFNDNHTPNFEMHFDNLGQFDYYIRNNSMGKSKVRFPSVDEEGNFDQRYAGALCGCIDWVDEQRFNDGDISSHVTLITENGKILFSSGHLTDKKGHISKAVKEMISNLKAWQSEAYDFAE